MTSQSQKKIALSYPVRIGLVSASLMAQARSTILPGIIQLPPSVFYGLKMFNTSDGKPRRFNILILLIELFRSLHCHEFSLFLLRNSLIKMMTIVTLSAASWLLRNLQQTSYREMITVTEAIPEELRLGVRIPSGGYSSSVDCSMVTESDLPEAEQLTFQEFYRIHTNPLQNPTFIVIRSTVSSILLTVLTMMLRPFRSVL
uniref:Uncharacterized protein n=1 Tax=Vespula pensylvanica TaxID=30213 RepID=A0A834JPM6_VESPE|nr:hypothetical protein H0235_017482 [Vespula pensylvanica]